MWPYLPLSLVVAVEVENIDDLTVSEVLCEGFKDCVDFWMVETIGEYVDADSFVGIKVPMKVDAVSVVGIIVPMKVDADFVLGAVITVVDNCIPVNIASVDGIVVPSTVDYSLDNFKFYL